MYYGYVEFDVLEEKVLTNVEVINDEEIIFTCLDGCVYKMYHEQDCCENVYLEDVNGDFKDLLYQPILLAESSYNSGTEGEYGDSFTWTFYKLATNKGYVNIRWYGSSNGYYSESANFVQVAGENNNHKQNNP